MFVGVLKYLMGFLLRYLLSGISFVISLLDLLIHDSCTGIPNFCQVARN